MAGAGDPPGVADTDESARRRAALPALDADDVMEVPEAEVACVPLEDATLRELARLGPRRWLGRRLAAEASGDGPEGPPTPCPGTGAAAIGRPRIATPTYRKLAFGRGRGAGCETDRGGAIQLPEASPGVASAAAAAATATAATAAEAPDEAAPRLALEDESLSAPRPSE